MWGFLSGTMILIVMQAVLQPSAANNLSQAGGSISTLLSKFLSSSVPGIRTTKASTVAASASGATAASSPALGSQLAAGAAAAASINGGLTQPGNPTNPGTPGLLLPNGIQLP